MNFLLHKDKSTAAFPLESCIQVIGETSCPEDLVFLHDVNQATILNCIRERFLEKKIYTSVGSVLMTVNPFERIAGIYGPSMIKKYSDPEEKKLLAHVYEIPSRAYYNMCRAGGNQSILISGESGAGKTEATKQCLSYLTVVANTSGDDGNHGKRGAPGGLTVTEIANRIIAASPILEAFGNAKTIRNPNSSRFGKWMVLNFDNKNSIHSSNVVSYLLEKSRVTKRDTKERNYHIFYQILRGCDRDLLGAWKVSPEARNFLYLQQDDGKEPVNLDDAAQFQETESAFAEMGFSVAETRTIFKVVCAILLLGNVCFNPINDGEGSEVANTSVVDAVAELLSVNPAILVYALTNRSIESRKSMIAIVLNPQKATESRDSLARQLYDKVFLSIITQINLKSRINEGGEDFDRCIGLLDIFGFEIFVENSFEQVCINYCNEMLQHHFNFVVFTAEKNLYLQEGIVCETIEFRDNSEVIREIEGMFKTLDEEARIPKGNSKTWFDKLKRGAKLANVSFPNRRVGQVFVVKHYAGDVDYNPLGLLEKNTEALSNDLVGAMLSSTEALVQAMFDPNPIAPADAATVSGRRRLSLTNPGAELDAPKAPAAAAGKKGASSALAMKSISWNFTNQLNALMSMLKKTESHFIRCVKSNDRCAPQIFESKLVHKQLLYSGVFEVVKIQQSGLPCRLKHEEFLTRYKCLAPSRMRYKLANSKELLTYLTTTARYELPMAQMGRKKTFFKSQEQRVLETARNELFRTSVTKIQRFIRRVICSYYYRHMRTHLRVFMHSYNELILGPAQEAFDGFNQFLAIFARIRRYPILKHVAERLVKQLSILSQRVELVAEARRRLLVRTEEGVLALQDIVTSALDLDLTLHPVVVECKTALKLYFRALEFMDLVSVPVRLRQLGMTHINEGIESLERYQDLLSGATLAIEQAQTHKRLVDLEIKNVVSPLRTGLMNAAMLYDSATGNLKPKLRGSEDHVGLLRGIVKKYSEQSMNFNCTDSQYMYNDCANFLTFLEEFVPTCDAIGALQFIDSRECKQSSNALFIAQLDEFRKWSDMQMSTVKLKQAMAVGKVSLSSLGTEPPVQVDVVKEILDQLSALREPSQNLKTAIRAGDWILKVRACFLSLFYHTPILH
jgi:myosin heavy subunit